MVLYVCFSVHFPPMVQMSLLVSKTRLGTEPPNPDLMFQPELDLVGHVWGASEKPTALLYVGNSLCLPMSYPRVDGEEAWTPVRNSTVRSLERCDDGFNSKGATEVRTPDSQTETQYCVRPFKVRYIQRR